VDDINRSILVASQRHLERQDADLRGLRTRSATLLSAATVATGLLLSDGLTVTSVPGSSWRSSAPSVT
jgi:hypothetical protein